MIVGKAVGGYSLSSCALVSEGADDKPACPCRCRPNDYEKSPDSRIRHGCMPVTSPPGSSLGNPFTPIVPEEEKERVAKARIRSRAQNEKRNGKEKSFDYRIRVPSIKKGLFTGSANPSINAAAIEIYFWRILKAKGVRFHCVTVT